MRWKSGGAGGRLAAVATLVAVTGLAPLASSQPAAASYGISQRLGWDACGVSTTAHAQAFWTNTPFSNMGLYLGGSSYGTGCTRWTAAQVTTLHSQGWKFLPLWVGPQAPCTSFGSRFSSTASTAYSQGVTEAVSAYNKIVSYGWDTLKAPIIYDLEAFDTTNSTCVTAARNFINGWVHQIHAAPAQLAGVYGSTCASDLNAYAGLANPPDFIDGATWTGVKSTGTMACISAGNWTNKQRHKQYQGGHNETWNGVTLNIDSDCSNGPVYPAPDALSTGTGCV